MNATDRLFPDTDDQMTHILTLNKAAVENLLDSIPPFVIVQETPDGLEVTPVAKNVSQENCVPNLSNTGLSFEYTDTTGTFANAHAISVHLAKDGKLSLKATERNLESFRPAATARQVKRPRSKVSSATAVADPQPSVVPTERRTSGRFPKIIEHREFEIPQLLVSRTVLPSVSATVAAATGLRSTKPIPEPVVKKPKKMRTAPVQASEVAPEPKQMTIPVSAPEPIESKPEAQTQLAPETTDAEPATSGDLLAFTRSLTSDWLRRPILREVEEAPKETLRAKRTTTSSIAVPVRSPLDGSRRVHSIEVVRRRRRA